MRNRLTEIWCDSTTNEIDLVAIVEHNLVQHVRENGVGQILVSFVNWLQNNDLGQKCIVSVRDYLSWVHFINCMISPPMVMALKDAIIHGACMTVLDGLGTGNTGGETLVIPFFVLLFTNLKKYTLYIRGYDVIIFFGLFFIYAVRMPKHFDIMP